MQLVMNKLYNILISSAQPITCWKSQKILIYGNMVKSIHERLAYKTDVLYSHNWLL